MTDEHDAMEDRMREAEKEVLDKGFSGVSPTAAMMASVVWMERHNKGRRSELLQAISATSGGTKGRHVKSAGVGGVVGGAILGVGELARRLLVGRGVFIRLREPYRTVGEST